MSQEYTEKNWTLIYIFPLIILGVFMIGYWPVFQKLFIRWEEGDSSYCYLIVPLFAYLLWDLRAKRGVKDYGLRGKGRNQESEIRSQEAESEAHSAENEGKSTPVKFVTLITYVNFTGQGG